MTSPCPLSRPGQARDMSWRIRNRHRYRASEQQYDFERMSHLDCLRFSFGFSYCPEPPDELFGDFGRRAALPVPPCPDSAAGFPHDPAAEQGTCRRPPILRRHRADSLLLAHCQPQGAGRAETRPDSGYDRQLTGTRFAHTPLEGRKESFHEHGPARGRDRGTAARA